MRKLIILFLCCSITYVSKAQDAKAILKFAFEKCQNIKSGHFVNFAAYKSFGDAETKMQSIITFKKTENDTISPCLFYAQIFMRNQPYRYSLYTGKEYISYFTTTDIGETVANDKYPSYAKSRCGSDFYQFFEPFLAKRSSPLPKYSDLDNPSINYSFIGIETVNGFKCWHVQSVRSYDNEAKEIVKKIEFTNDYWINLKDTVVVQYHLTTQSLVSGETQISTKKVWLESYEFDNLVNDALFKPTAVPKYVTLKDFVPKPIIELLKVGTTAPSFKIKTIDDKAIKMKDLKDKVVLLLFSNLGNSSIGRFPITGLESIHQKYPNIEILVFNCYGNDIDGLKQFAAANNISLPISNDYESVKKDYNVTSYPTYYLIDENGKVFLSILGYSNKITEKRIEAALEKHLSLNINKQ